MPFSLLSLPPELMKKRILGNLDVVELFYASFCSAKMRTLIKEHYASFPLIFKPKLQLEMWHDGGAMRLEFSRQFNSRYALVESIDFSFADYRSVCYSENENLEKMPVLDSTMDSLDIRKLRYAKFYCFGDAMGVNILKVGEYLQWLYGAYMQRVIIHPDLFDDMSTVLASQWLWKSRWLTVSPGAVTGPDMTAILNAISKVNERVEIKADPGAGFVHDKPITANLMTIRHAHWVTLTQMLKLKVTAIEIDGMPKLNDQELITFIKTWMRKKNDDDLKCIIVRGVEKLSIGKVMGGINRKCHSGLHDMLHPARTVGEKVRHVMRNDGSVMRISMKKDEKYELKLEINALPESCFNFLSSM